MFGMKMAMCVCVLGFYAMTAEGACPTATNWLNATCESNDNCMKANAECYYGECKCSPGFFYSQSTKDCLASCDPKKLGAPFQVYKWRAIYLNGLLTLRGVSLDACLAACNDNPKCISVDYRPKYQYCHMKHVTKLTAKDEGTYGYHWHGNYNYNHYQKSCM